MYMCLYYSWCVAIHISSVYHISLGLSWHSYFLIVEVGCQSLSCVQLFATPWTIPTRLLYSWNSPGKNTGVGCHSCFHGIFPTQGSKLASYNAGRFFTTWATREALKLVSEFISFLAYKSVITCKTTIYILINIGHLLRFICK